MANQFPNQRLTTAQKKKKYGSVEDWGKEVMESTLSMCGYGSSTHYNDIARKQSNVLLAKGKFSWSGLEHVLKPLGLTDYTFPTTGTHYDMISPKLNLLRGEEIKRPFNFKVVSTGSSAYKEMEDYKKKLIGQMIQQRIVNKLSEMGVDIESEEGEAMTREGIEEKMKEYSNPRELAGNDSMEYLVKEQNLLEKFNDGWYDFLVNLEEIYWTGIVNGEPFCRNVNPLNCEFDKSLSTKYIEDAAWVIEWRDLTASEVYDEFYDVLTEKQVLEVEELKGSIVNNTVDQGGIPFVYENVEEGLLANTYYNNSSTMVKVIRMEWKSLRKIGFLTYIDEEGQLQERIVSENYKVSKKEDEVIEWKWINEVWEATRIGNDIYVQIRPKPNQHRSMSNPSKCKLGYTGVKMDYSIVDMVRPHQALYNIIMHHLELAVARAKGKGMIFDVAQIPRSQGFDVERWMYYLDVMGVAFINSFEEGSGPFKGQKPSFNQFKEFDFTISSTINQYLGILEKLEDMIGDITGVSKQRQGTISTNELVGTTERAVVQSSHVTEPFFYIHNEVKKRVLTNLLEEAKLAWLSGKKGQYILSDLSRTFFSVDEGMFLDSDYKVFVSNSSKDDRILNSIKELAQVAMKTNQASFKDIIMIMKSESISDAENILVQSEAEAQQRAAEQAQQEMAMQQQESEVEQGNKEADREVVERNNLRDNQTKVLIKQMEEGGKNIAEGVKQNKLNLQERQMQIEENLKKLKLTHDKDKADKDFEVKKEKNKLTKKKM